MIRGAFRGGSVIPLFVLPALFLVASCSIKETGPDASLAKTDIDAGPEPMKAELQPVLLSESSATGGAAQAGRDFLPHEACPYCRIPKGFVDGPDSPLFPETWKWIQEHPSITPGRWIPQPKYGGIMYCEYCGTFWRVVYNQKEGYYSYFYPLPKEVAGFLRADAGLEQLWTAIDSSAAEIGSLIYDYLGSEEYDVEAAFAGITSRLVEPGLTCDRTMLLLSYYRPIVTGRNLSVVESRRRLQTRAGAPSPFAFPNPEDLLVVAENIERTCDAGKRPIARNHLTRFVRDAFVHIYFSGVSLVHADSEIIDRLRGIVGYEPRLLRALGQVRDASTHLRARGTCPDLPQDDVREAHAEIRYFQQEGGGAIGADGVRALIDFLEVLELFCQEAVSSRGWPYYAKRNYVGLLGGFRSRGNATPEARNLIEAYFARNPVE